MLTPSEQPSPAHPIPRDIDKYSNILSLHSMAISLKTHPVLENYSCAQTYSSYPLNKTTAEPLDRHVSNPSGYPASRSLPSGQFPHGSAEGVSRAPLVKSSTVTSLEYGIEEKLNSCACGGMAHLCLKSGQNAERIFETLCMIPKVGDCVQLERGGCWPFLKHTYQLLSEDFAHDTRGERVLTEHLSVSFVFEYTVHNWEGEFSLRKVFGKALVCCVLRGTH